MPILTHNMTIVGGVYYLRLALQKYPDKGLVLYHRWGLRDRGSRVLSKLKQDTALVRNEIEKVAPGKLQRDSFFALESGKMAALRPVLNKAAEYARSRDLIVVAEDITRFIRPSNYEYGQSCNEMPTDAEFEQLRLRTSGVILATLFPPTKMESPRRVLVIERLGKRGRPSTTRSIEAEILQARAEGKSYQQIADKFEIDKQAVYRALKRIPR